MSGSEKNETYLVTGAAGFIGMHTAKALLATGAKVIGYDNLNDYYNIVLKTERLAVLMAYPNFNFYQADILNKEKLFEVVKDHKITIVIHLAAQAGVRYSLENPEAYIQSNIVGFFYILEACRQFKIKHLLYASSSSVYGNNAKIPFSVKDTVDYPVSLYAATKKSNELLAYTYSYLYKFATTGMRFFTVYGPYGRPDMAYYKFTKAILEDMPIQIFNNGNLYRDFTYIDDVTKGIMALIQNSKACHKTDAPYQVYNIGNNAPVKILDFILEIEKALGKTAIKEYLPMQKGDVYRTYADVDELSRDAKYKPDTPLSVGIAKFVEWFKKIKR